MSALPARRLHEPCSYERGSHVMRTGCPRSRPRFRGGVRLNWLDEGALYSSIGLFLREDLGRGDITTQSVLTRNARARGRFVAGEQMVVAGLEAAEEVFVTLDPQQQLEAFSGD